MTVIASADSGISKAVAIAFAHEGADVMSYLNDDLRFITQILILLLVVLATLLNVLLSSIKSTARRPEPVRKQGTIYHFSS